MESNGFSNKEKEPNSSMLEIDNDEDDDQGDDLGDEALGLGGSSISDDRVYKRGKWTREEDETLKKVVAFLGEKKWKKISQYIPGRSPIQCLHRWNKILRPGLVKGPWGLEEDEKLLRWVQKEGPRKWSQCARLISGRSGKQCRERWMNNLNPKINKGSWSDEEDERLYSLFLVYGSSWSKIAREFEARTENCIKNRFYSTLRKIRANNFQVPPPSPDGMNEGRERLAVLLVQLILEKKEDDRIRKNILRLIEGDEKYRQRAANLTRDTKRWKKTSGRKKPRRDPEEESFGQGQPSTPPEEEKQEEVRGEATTQAYEGGRIERYHRISMMMQQVSSLEGLFEKARQDLVQLEDNFFENLQHKYRAMPQN